MVDAFEVVRMFERAISEYTGASYVVATNSCTNALLLAFQWYKEHGGEGIEIPANTYCSVPMSAKHVGLKINYNHYDWIGQYKCYPSNIWDSAKLNFSRGIYIPGEVQCLSFHARKSLPIGTGGAILHDNKEADEWYRRARWDCRREGTPTKDDDFDFPGWHFNMTPPDAARGLWLMMYCDSADGYDYPDMSRWTWQR
jgi:dTDP-4-amino-4,6-dideoxygalactose transaminase